MLYFEQIWLFFCCLLFVRLFVALLSFNIWEWLKMKKNLFSLQIVWNPKKVTVSFNLIQWKIASSNDEICMEQKHTVLDLKKNFFDSIEWFQLQKHLLQLLFFIIKTKCMHFFPLVWLIIGCQPTNQPTRQTDKQSHRLSKRKN